MYEEPGIGDAGRSMGLIAPRPPIPRSSSTRGQHVEGGFQGAIKNILLRYALCFFLKFALASWTLVAREICMFFAIVSSALLMLSECLDSRTMLSSFWIRWWH